MHGTSEQAAQQPRCTSCGGDTRLLVNLSGVTGEADYELWYCDACGLRERLGRSKQGPLPRFGYRPRDRKRAPARY